MVGLLVQLTGIYEHPFSAAGAATAPVFLGILPVRPPKTTSGCPRLPLRNLASLVLRVEEHVCARRGKNLRRMPVASVAATRYDPSIR